MNKRTTASLHKKYLYIIAIVYIYTTLNNTLITVTDIQGKVIIFCSAGFLNLKGSKRSTAYAGQSVATLIGKKLVTRGIRLLYVKLKGFGSARRAVLKGFTAANLKIITIKDHTSIPHNGCTPKKQRRI
jgi:small subunit ribosomal protein S11